MKKPGPRVSIFFTVFQFLVSIKLTTPSFRFGVARTVVSRYGQVMPEPRCGMPGSSTSAILRPTTRLHHLAVVAVACGADQVRVVLVEKEIIDVVIEPDAPYRKAAAFREAFLHAVVVHQSPVDRRRVVGYS